MLNKVVGLVAEGKLTEARKIVREELDNRKESMMQEGKAFVAASIKADKGDKGEDEDKGEKGKKTPSHDGGAD